MSGVDIDAVDARNFVGRINLEVKRIEESTLVEVQSVNLMAGSGNDSIARWVVVGNRSTGFGYSRAMVEATLVVQRDGTVVLKM